MKEGKKQKNVKRKEEEEEENTNAHKTTLHMNLS
jgi:hypothetical protein